MPIVNFHRVFSSLFEIVAQIIQCQRSALRSAFRNSSLSIGTIYLVGTNAIIIFARANERDCASENLSERVADVSRGYFLVVDEGNHWWQVCQAWKVVCRFLRDHAVTSLRLRKHCVTDAKPSSRLSRRAIFSSSRPFFNPWSKAASSKCAVRKNF